MYVDPENETTFVWMSKFHGCTFVYVFVWFQSKGGKIQTFRVTRNERKVRLYFTSECDKCIVVNLSSLLYVVNATVNKWYVSSLRRNQDTCNKFEEIFCCYYDEEWEDDRKFNTGRVMKIEFLTYEWRCIPRKRIGKRNLREFYVNQPVKMEWMENGTS